MGMEVSEPFDCGYEHRTDRDPGLRRGGHIDRWLDRALGPRRPPAGDHRTSSTTRSPASPATAATIGTIVNGGQLPPRRAASGTSSRCQDAREPRPRRRTHGPTHNDDRSSPTASRSSLPGEQLPVYPTGPLCNQRGLDRPGRARASGEIMDRRMVFDPDHMSVIAPRRGARHASRRSEYPGLISSHSWSTQNTLPRVYRLGGVITPYAGSSEGFVHQWERPARHVRDELGRQYFGVGYGADMNGFGSQGGPRGADVPNPVTYPFTVIDGTVTFDAAESRGAERIRHQHRRGRPLRPLPRLGRGPAEDHGRRRSSRT